MESIISAVEGYMYPNEMELQWSVLIVLYPFITGLVAGAFILASLERVFRVEAVKPTYRLALLTALAFLLVAPLPLQLHLNHPERSLEMYLTPHTSSAMAMFGFVYLWYLMVVLVFEIWLDYRKDIVLLSRSSSGMLRKLYKVLTLGSDNISEASLRVDERVVDRSELYLSDEVFLTGTAAHVQAVGTIDHRPVGSGAVGPVTKRLQELYFTLVRGENPKYLSALTPATPRVAAR